MLWSFVDQLALYSNTMVWCYHSFIYILVFVSRLVQPMQINTIFGPPNWSSCKKKYNQNKWRCYTHHIHSILFKTSWGLHFWLKMIWFWLPTSFGTSVWRAPCWTVTCPCGAYPPGTTMALKTSSQTSGSSSGRTTFPGWDGWYVANSNKIGGWIFRLVRGTNDGKKGWDGTNPFLLLGLLMATVADGDMDRTSVSIVGWSSEKGML